LVAWSVSPLCSTESTPKITQAKKALDTNLPMEDYPKSFFVLENQIERQK
jgi:hypothetical protein